MDMIAVGIVRTTHGVQGFLKIKSFSGDSDHFFRMKEVLLKKAPREQLFRIEDVKTHGTEVLLKLEGINTPEVGKSYAGWEIWVPREFASPLLEGEYYHADLCGLTMFYNDSVVGTVESVIENGGSDLLVIEKDGKVWYIPFIEQFVGDVNIAGRRIELKVDWLLT